MACKALTSAVHPFLRMLCRSARSYFFIFTSTGLDHVVIRGKQAEIIVGVIVAGAPTHESDSVAALEHVIVEDTPLREVDLEELMPKSSP